MSTQLKQFQKTHSKASLETRSVMKNACLHDGDACDLFTSGSAPTMSGDALLGDAAGLFTSGSASLGNQALTGDATGLFTSGSAPTGKHLASGDGTALFTSGS